ncbi:hypothetical protein [Legionella sp. km772]|uniref:hypothetical protein n=1 Tax=Legionella sp. km772 TaxID=2498111 RepID=UPI000F8DFF2F|nr:hypothetical protein [Legionella sp. km772]RUR09803.1 hypothetical protein ELY15_08835 [Legionella sp. km772]
MQEKIEPKKTPDTALTYASAPYIVSNLVAKTAGISFTVSLVTQPFQSLLTQLQMSGTSAVSGGLFRGLYRGFLPYAVAGQKRGAVAVTSKHANKEAVVEEEIEAELPLSRKWAGTLAFAQADHFISNALYGKAKLTSAGIITADNFKWSPFNIYKLTMVNWGSRSIAGFVNFAAIGFVGDKFSSFYHFEQELLNKIAGGATAGVFATFFTTLPNAYADRKLLATTVENKRLLTTSPFTMFRSMEQHVKKVGLKSAASELAYTNFLREFIIRSPQAALTFATILGMDYMMGTEPLKAIWPKRAMIEDQPSESPTKRM